MRGRPMRGQLIFSLSRHFPLRSSSVRLTVARWPHALKPFLSLLLVFVAISLQSCSIFSSSSRASLLEIDNYRSAEGSPLLLQRIPGETALYRVLPSEGKPSSFAALLSDCRDDQKRALPAEAALRQLFVGTENLRINSKQQFPAPLASISMTELSATVEGAPLQLISFSTREENCYYDLVIWSKEGDGNNELLKGQSSQLAALLQQVAKGTS